jgi:hypothetical protein
VDIFFDDAKDDGSKLIAKIHKVKNSMDNTDKQILNLSSTPLSDNEDDNQIFNQYGLSTTP